MARYFSGSATSAQKASSTPDDEGEHAVGEEEAAHVRDLTQRSWRLTGDHLEVLPRLPAGAIERDLLPDPAPPDERGERAEEPPLEGVEQVADRGEPPGVRQLLQVRTHQAVPAVVGERVRAVVADDDVRAVQVLVDVLDEVGDPQLGKYVVGRVVVDRRVGFRRLQPADQVDRPGRVPAALRGKVLGDRAVQPRTTGSSESPTRTWVTTQ